MKVGTSWKPVISENEKYKVYYSLTGEERTRKFEEITKMWVVNAYNWQQDTIKVAVPYLKNKDKVHIFELNKTIVMDCLESGRNLVFMCQLKKAEYA